MHLWPQAMASSSGTEEIEGIAGGPLESRFNRAIVPQARSSRKHAAAEEQWENTATVCRETLTISGRGQKASPVILAAGRRRRSARRGWIEAVEEGVKWPAERISLRRRSLHFPVS